MKINSRLFHIFFFAVFFLVYELSGYPLIPRPQEIKYTKGIIEITSPIFIIGAEENKLANENLTELLRENNLVFAEDESKAKTIITIGKNAAEKFIKNIDQKIPLSSSEAYFLKIFKERNKAVVILAGRSENGSFYAIQTLRQILISGLNVKALEISDYPMFTKERGYGEFFYGKPWTHEERLAAFKFISETKMNFYMYSPKDDPYNRDLWKEDYPDIEMKRMQELVQYAKKHFITFSFAVNPGLSIKYSDDEDFRILMKKYDAARALGITNFSLQLDDLGNATKFEEDAKRFKKPGEAHAFLFNRVYDALKAKDKNIEYSICGVMYYIAKPDDYTYTIGEAVYPEIPIMWTGGDVVDDFISVDEVYLYASGIKRKPFISDNYPVNDFSTNRLFMGPLTGRPNELVYHVYPGFLENPMNQEEASKIALATIADYAWNPLNYNPEESWNNAILLVGGKKGFGALRLFCENNRNSVMEKRESVELTKLVNDYLETRSSDSYYKLEKYLSRLSTIKSDLDKTVDNKKLLAEIEPWTNETVLMGKAGLCSLEIIGLKNLPIKKRWDKLYELKTIVSQISKSPELVCGKTLEPIFNAALVSGDGFGINYCLSKTTYDASGKKTLNHAWSRTTDFMTDNNINTYFMPERNLEKGDYIEIEFKAPRPVTSIDVFMTTQTLPQNFIYNGKLQCSFDMKKWTDISRAFTPNIKWDSDKPIHMKAVRIISNSPQKYPPAVNEFVVKIADRPEISGSLIQTSKSDKSFINDGNIANEFKIETPLKADDFIELTFPNNPESVSEIIILSDKNAFINNGVVEISQDRINWQKTGEISSPASSIKIKPQKIKSLRVKITKEQTSPVNIYEIGVLNERNLPY